MLSEVVYTPESSLKRPTKLLRDMWRDLLASRELAWCLMRRDISAQYRQSILGIAWAFVPPIVTAAGFTLANNAKIINVGVTDLPYPAYIAFNVALWQTFVEALNGPLSAVLSAQPILARINFPREAIILAKLGEVFFNFAVKLILIVLLFLWYRIPVHSTVVLAPVALLQLIVLGTSLGLLLAPLGSLYHDVQRGLAVFTGVWFFLTPVIYPVPGSGTFGAIVRLNPVTPLLVTTRELATAGAVSDPYWFSVVSVVTLVGLLLAWIMYRLAMPFVVERVSS